MNQDGKVIGWVVVCPQTGEWIYRCATRREAREHAEACGCLIAAIRISH